MTDKELIEALRCCGKAEELADCEHCPANAYSCAGAFLRTAERLEALIAENELLYREVARLEAERDHFREVTKMVPQWHPASEPPEEYRDEYGELKCFLVWVEGGSEAFRAFYDGKNWGDGLYAFPVTHWMPLPEPPSTEGVE